MQTKKIKLVFLLLLCLTSPYIQANTLYGQDLKIFKQAGIAMSQHNWEQAEKLLTQLRDQFPNNDHVRNNLAVTYFNQGRLDEAQELFSEIIGSTEPTRIAFENLQTLYGYSAAKAYSKGLNLLKPIELPSMIARNYTEKTPPKNTIQRPAKQQAKVKTRAKSEPDPIESPVVVAMLNNNEEANAAADNISEPLPVTKKEPQTLPQEEAENAEDKPKQEVKPTKTALVKPLAEIQTQDQLKTQNDTTLSNPKVLLDQLNAWARAWSNGDYEKYISFYSPNYSPRGKSRKSWLKNRRSRVKASKQIKVNLSQQEVFIDKNNNRGNTSFTQEYRSKNYKDKVKKRITWIKLNNRWVISQEVILKTL